MTKWTDLVALLDSPFCDVQSGAARQIARHLDHPELLIAVGEWLDRQTLITKKWRAFVPLLTGPQTAVELVRKHADVFTGAWFGWDVPHPPSGPPIVIDAVWEEALKDAFPACLPRIVQRLLNHTLGKHWPKDVLNEAQRFRLGSPQAHNDFLRRQRSRIGHRAKAVRSDLDEVFYTACLAVASTRIEADGLDMRQALRIAAAFLPAELDLLDFDPGPLPADWPFLSEISPNNWWENIRAYGLDWLGPASHKGTEIQHVRAILAPRNASEEEQILGEVLWSTIPSNVPTAALRYAAMRDEEESLFLSELVAAEQVIAWPWRMILTGVRLPWLHGGPITVESTQTGLQGFHKEFGKWNLDYYDLQSEFLSNRPENPVAVRLRGEQSFLEGLALIEKRQILFLVEIRDELQVGSRFPPPPKKWLVGPDGPRALGTESESS